MTTGAHLVSIAKADLGKGEVPPGSNTGPFVVSCQRDTFLAGTRWPWCAAAVCHWAKRAGVPLSYPSAGAHDLYNHYRAQAVSLADAKAGDVVDFNIGSGHTGILVSKSVPGTVTTIDGNWGDKVTLVTHPESLIRGIWRIPGISTTKPEKTKLPPFVVTTSESGHRKVVFRIQTKKGLIAWLGAHQLARLFPNGIQISRGKRR